MYTSLKSCSSTAVSQVLTYLLEADFVEGNAPLRSISNKQNPERKDTELNVQLFKRASLPEHFAACHNMPAQHSYSA